MARPRRPESPPVPIGLEVTDTDAARIDQVLARPEFAGWTRADWCLEIIRTALRYYGGRPVRQPGQDRAPARPAPAEPVPAVPVPAAPEPAPEPAEPEPAEPGPVAPEPPSQPECSHPADARDYQTGACAACGAILWD